MITRPINYCPICHDYVDIKYIENGIWVCLTCGAELEEEIPEERIYD